MGTDLYICWYYVGEILHANSAVRTPVYWSRATHALDTKMTTSHNALCSFRSCQDNGECCCFMFLKPSSPALFCGSIIPSKLKLMFIRIFLFSTGISLLCPYPLFALMINSPVLNVWMFFLLLCFQYFLPMKVNIRGPNVSTATDVRLCHLQTIMNAAAWISKASTLLCVLILPHSGDAAVAYIFPSSSTSLSLARYCQAGDVWWSEGFVWHQSRRSYPNLANRTSIYCVDSLLGLRVLRDATWNTLV